MGGHEVPHRSHPTLDSKGGSTFPQWQNWRSLAAQNIRQRQQLPYQDQPESSKHETFFSTGFDAAGNADVPIIFTKAERISGKKERRKRVVVTSKNVVCKVVCALVMFLAVARCQVAVGGSYLSMLTGKRKQQMIFSSKKQSLFYKTGTFKTGMRLYRQDSCNKNETHLHSSGPRHP